MGKIIKNAFTLVELLVVIAIITLLSIWSVFYFLDFVKNQEISQRIILIEDNFNGLDKDIKNYKIYDYELLFNTSTLSKWYISYLNNFDINFNQTIDFNSSTWSWTIESNWSSAQEWKIKLFKKNKLFLFETKEWDKDYKFDFNEESYYKLSWTLSWEILNEIHINYFSEDNIYPERNNSLILHDINSQSDWKWTSYSKAIIKNIWWKKEIKCDSIDLAEIYLIFENNWKEKFIKINK